MRVTDTHVYFWSGPFSNFAPAPTRIVIDHLMESITFPTSEHAYMAKKALYFKDYSSYNAIAQAQTPEAAKAIGRQVSGFVQEVWDEVKYDAMCVAVCAKFEQNEKYWKALEKTKNKILVEASPYDRIWGVGLGEGNDLILDEKNWRGENLLGKVLMDIRKLINEMNEPEDIFSKYINEGDY